VDSFVDARLGRVCVTVTDNGLGIAPEVARRLFRPFASTKGRRGTGLGLYISRQLVRETEGELELIVHEERGARFLLWLPFARAATPEPRAAALPPEASPALAGIRVLVVDDEELIRRPMLRFLSKRGAEARDAGDGLQALEMIRGGFEPHVILADLRMPRLDGVGFYEQLLEERPALAERVVFLSGDITQLAGRGLAEIPRDRVLVKPVELVELERRIVDFVRERAA
jgi:two-component system cell cycle sensor histidine kinase/response regulator CckA